MSVLFAFLFNSTFVLIKKLFLIAFIKLYSAYVILLLTNRLFERWGIPLRGSQITPTRPVTLLYHGANLLRTFPILRVFIASD